MDSSGRRISSSPSPIRMSSSVSMFIEDSRITAVANADVNPRNPGCFYTVSSYTHSPTATSSQSPFSQSRQSSQNWNYPSASQSQQQMDSISQTDDVDCDDYAQSQGQCWEEEDDDFASCRSYDSSTSSRMRSRPQELFHKIIREESQTPQTEEFRRQSYSSLPASVVVTRRHSAYNPSCATLPPDFERVISFSSGSNSKPRCQNQKTTLNIEPSTPIFNVRDNFSSKQNIRDDRTYTSVNLTLRSPSTENKGFVSNVSSPTATASLNVNSVTEPVLCSCGATVRLPSASNTMTYSTFSNSQDGFEAQVQIQIGPNGGTISASRRKKETMVLTQMNAGLISAQAERKEKLQVTLITEKAELAGLQQEIAHLRSKLHPLVDDLEKLKDENQRLRIECQLMTREVDLYDNGTVPLGETSEEFYKDGFNPGQDLNALFGSTNNRRRQKGVEPGGQYPLPKPKPPRPPPPKYVPSPPPQEDHGPNAEWYCSMCTFLNSPYLAQCEQCGMVRVSRTPMQTGPTASSWQ